MRPLRRSLPGGLYEVSIRVTGQHLLLKPGQTLNELVLGVIGRCQHGKDGIGVRLHALAVLSSHYHMLVSVDDSQCLSNFQRFVNGNIATRVNKLLGRTGAFWERRFRAIPVVGDRTVQLWRLKYLMAHGVKEGLVERMGQWPGASSNAWLRDGTPLKGVWTDYSAMSNARRRKGYVEIPGQFDTVYELQMSPLPCFADTPATQWRSHIEQLVADIHADRDLAQAKDPRPVLGVAAILAADPFSRVLRGSHGRAPTVLTNDASLRRTAIRELRTLEAIWREAAAKIAAASPPNAIRPGQKLPGHLWPSLALPPSAPTRGSAVMSAGEARRL